jgi:cytochrome c-type biogenesis protein CcmH
MRRLALILMLALGPALLPAPVLAVQPDEVLDDPALEARARAISGGLRCLVCRNESIDDSNAEFARDMRLLVRERLLEGDSDPEVVAFVVARFGEYVLLRPTTAGANLILWLAGPAMLILGGGIAVIYLRRRSKASAPAEARLTAEEEAHLKQVLGGD